MFDLFKKEDKNLKWSIEKVYHDPDTWINDISKEQRLKTFSMKYIEMEYLNKYQGLIKDYIVITPTEGVEDFKLFENFVAFQISKRNERLGLNKNFWIQKPGESIESSNPVFFPKNIEQKIPEHKKETDGSQEISSEFLEIALKKVKLYYDQKKDLARAINDAYNYLEGPTSLDEILKHSPNYEEVERADSKHPDLPSFIDFVRIIEKNLKQIIPNYEEEKSKNKNDSN